MKYLYLAKKRGAKIAVVNPLREPGLERYWVPSNVESAVFGTKITDEFFPVHTGGDVAFVNGVLKQLLAIGRHRPRVRDASTRSASTSSSPSSRRSRSTDLERRSGATRRRHGAGSPTCTRRPRSRGARVVDGHHAARARCRQRAGDRQPRPRARQRRAAPARASCRSAATPACRAAPRWAATRRPSRAACRSTTRTPAALSDAVGLRRAERARAHGGRDGRRGAARRPRRAVVERRQLPRRAARARRHPRRRSHARRCASTRTSC